MSYIRCIFILVLLVFGGYYQAPLSASEQEMMPFVVDGSENIQSYDRSWIEIEIEENGIQKIQIKENCITIYFTENSHRFCEVSRCCFKCRGCYVFIHRDDSEHADLHKTEAEMEFSHFHLKHKKVNSVEEKEFDYFLTSLVHHRVISERQKRAYMSKFLIKKGRVVSNPTLLQRVTNFGWLFR